MWLAFRHGRRGVSGKTTDKRRTLIKHWHFSRHITRGSGPGIPVSAGGWGGGEVW